MTPFTAKIEALRKFREETDSILLENVKQFEAEVIDYVTEEQLLEGERADGTEIEPAYTPFTVEIKQAKGQPFDRVTLRDTGRFHDSISIEYLPASFAIVSDDSKARSLERKYGTNILGLNEEGVQDLIDLIRAPFIDEFRKSIL